MRLRYILFVLLAAVIAPIATASSLDEAVAGLQARFEATLVRDRRLADDREQRLLQEAEVRVQRARASADQRAAGAEVELATARREYAALASSIVSRDAEAGELSEAYEMQVRSDLLQASAGQIAGLQRFADGDLRVGYEAFREESRRRSAARRRIADQVVASANAADTADARQAAVLVDIMVSSGRATAAEGLEAWSEASRLAPEDSYAHVRLAQHSIGGRNLQNARSEAEAALRTASTPIERLGAYSVLGSVAGYSNDTAGAARAYDSAATVAREYSAQNGNVRLAWYLIRAATAYVARQEYPRAQSLFDEARTAIAARAQVYPNDRNNDYDSVYLALQLAAMHRAQGNPSQAARVVRDAGPEAERLMAAGRTRAQYVLFVAFLGQAGQIALDLHDPQAARQALEQTVELAHNAIAADPNSRDLQRDYSAALTPLADAARQLGDTRRAQALYRESLAIDERLYRADPTNAISVTDYWISLWRVARYAGGDWADVVRVMEDAQRRNLLPTQHRATLENARTLARERRRR